MAAQDNISPDQFPAADEPKTVSMDEYNRALSSGGFVPDNPQERSRRQKQQEPQQPTGWEASPGSVPSREEWNAARKQHKQRRPKQNRRALSGNQRNAIIGGKGRRPLQTSSDEKGPMAAAPISAREQRPKSGRTQVVSGGLPGLGKRR